MKTIALSDLKEIIGMQVAEWDNGYQYPYQVFIREVWVRYRKEAEAGSTFRVAGYGELKMNGRDYEFIPDEAYRKKKGYPKSIKGRWE